MFLADSGRSTDCRQSSAPVLRPFLKATAPGAPPRWRDPWLSHPRRFPHPLPTPAHVSRRQPPCKYGWKPSASCDTLFLVSTLTIQLDDELALLVKEAAQVAHQPLEAWLRENLCEAAARTVNRTKTAPRRLSPLHPDAMQPAADFNAPLAEFAS